jgi:hypothetical protein
MKEGRYGRSAAWMAAMRPGLPSAKEMVMR